MFASSSAASTSSRCRRDMGGEAHGEEERERPSDFSPPDINESRLGPFHRCDLDFHPRLRVLILVLVLGRPPRSPAAARPAAPAAAARARPEQWRPSPRSSSPRRVGLVERLADAPVRVAISPRARRAPTRVLALGLELLDCATACSYSCCASGSPAPAAHAGGESIHPRRSSSAARETTARRAAPPRERPPRNQCIASGRARRANRRRRRAAALRAHLAPSLLARGPQPRLISASSRAQLRSSAAVAPPVASSACALRGELSRRAPTAPARLQRGRGAPRSPQRAIGSTRPPQPLDPPSALGRSRAACSPAALRPQLGASSA